MAKLSAGLLIYRRSGGKTEVLLVHPGGPFWARKDAWGLPKGEYQPDENPVFAAKREFNEELGLPAPDGDYIELGEVKPSGGKTITAYAVESDMDVSDIVSNKIFIEWPPRSGQQIEVPEVDRAAWLEIGVAATKIHKNQDEFLARLAQKLGVEPSPPALEQASLF